MIRKGQEPQRHPMRHRYPRQDNSGSQLPEPALPSTRPPKVISPDPERVRGLVITPLDPQGQIVRETVVDALEEIGVGTFRLDNLSPGARWADAISRAIQAADLIFVDITHHNPNILYELGYAHALRKRTIILVNAQSGTLLPSDLQGFFYIPYDSGDLVRLREDVRWVALRHAECAVEG